MLSTTDLPSGPDGPPASGRAGAGGAGVVFWVAGAAALLYGLASAFRHRWICDDAFISFRYAENLVRGLGLVFNPGERVEGYSNFLWTLWSAVGISQGADVERWAKIAGLACYAAALGALIWNSWTLRKESPSLTRWIPVAALLGALHPDWNIFATSGLETSLFTLEIVLLYVLLARGDVGPWRAIGAGLLLAAASLTRPDGPVFAAATGLFLLLCGPRRLRTLGFLTAAYLAVWAPYTVWRIGFYGDYFPNTYYAKSGGIAWYSQGALYTALYFLKYWPLFLGAVLAVFAWPRSQKNYAEFESAAHDRWRYRAGLAGMLAAVYTAYVIRIGGDFMFARFLIPVTPLLLVIFELFVARIAAARSHLQWTVTGVAAVGILLTPYPLPKDPYASFSGVVFEPNFYGREASDMGRNQGLVLRRCFQGLPVRLAFYGGEARLVYYARPMVAIECATGLTDSHIARQPLTRRGRVGHEKPASPDYVLGVRNAHFCFFRNAAGALHLDHEIPPVEIEIRGVRGRVLTWDPALIESLRSRGAMVQDFPAELDRLLSGPSLSLRDIEWLRPEKLHRFYFANANDPAREALWHQRLREVGVE